MGEGEWRLLEPAEGMREEYLGYIEEFRAAGAFNHQDHREEVIRDFEGFLRRCRDDAAGRNLGGTRVPQANWWLFGGGRLRGTCRLRHRLNEILARHGGHIGYDVRPGEQGKGYATAMVAMVLEKARQLGLTRVMLTCKKDNPASARVIVKNGGVLEQECWWEENGRRLLIQNYWIELPQ